MRLLYLICLFLAGITSVAQQAPVLRISGNWNNWPGQKVRLLMPAEAAPDQYLVADSAVLNKAGRFQLATRLSHPSEAYLDCGDLELPLFLNPGDQLTLQLSTQEPNLSIIFSGPGSLVNNYLVLRSQRLTRLEQLRMKALKMKPARFLVTIDSIRKAEENLLLKHFITPVPLSPDEFSFQSWQARQLGYENATDKLRFAVLNRNSKEETLPFRPEEITSTISAPRPGEVIGNSYLQFAEAVVEYRLMLEAKQPVANQPGWRSTTTYQIIKQEFKGPVKVALLDKFIRRQAAQSGQRKESEALLAVLTKDREAPAGSIFMLQQSLKVKAVKPLAVNPSASTKTLKNRK